MISNRRRGRTPTKFMVSWSVTVSTYNMVPTIFSLYMLLLCPFFLYCSSIDIMTSNSTFTIIDGETTLVSAGERFELGFFSPNRILGYDRYVGIWYYKLEPLTVVWVANRDNPVPFGTGSFAITEDGNLKVLDKEGNVYWTTDLDASPPSLKTAKLLDSGNLIFGESSSGKILWESFKNSTDTFLPGMKMDEGLVLTSWKSLDDPAAGNYTFQMDGNRKDQFIIQKRSSPYWKSGESDKIVSSDHIPFAVASLLSNVGTTSKPTNSTFHNLTIPSFSVDSVTRLVMGFDGVLRYLSWDFNKTNWSLIWSEPRDLCSVYNACGNFGSCNINNTGLMCKCLPGFEPSSVEKWNSGEFSGGCERKSPICGESDEFLTLNMMKVGNPDTPYTIRNMSEDDCRKECLNNCICKAYLFDEPKNNTRRGKGGTSSPTCWIWNEDLINVQEEEEYVDGSRHLHLRVGSLDKVLEGGGSTTNLNGSSRRKMPLTLKIAVTCIVFFLIALSCTIAYVFYTRKRRASTSQGHRNNIQSDHALHQFGSESRVKHFIDSGEFREDDKKGIDVPFFDLESILAATDNFSDTNKLGQGGFGPVYKGKFQGDQEIAVKRLSSLSGQGLQEFKNEVVLIAKLQHRNLVRLLGYCISGEEKILLYEYMPNKSLDSFIFDRTLSVLLDWEVRFNIILGVARGLLYLHQDSRLRIIHRDLKTSNILLDEEMNPKISDFGLARIFAGKQTEAATERIIGTYGYMSPEYALDGFFSVKSDVFSFGVVVLEIISGKRTTGSYQSEQSLSLLGYAWRFWKEEKALELMDQTLLETCNTSEFLKCVNVGLLCVQEDPNDRPAMSNVVFMLGNETATLPSPKQPAFVAKRGFSTTGSSSSKQEAWSYNELTITSEDGR